MRWRTVSGEGFESAGFDCCMPHQPHTIAPAAPTFPAAANSTPGFVRALGVGVGRGAYPPALLSEWHRWDAEHASENDPVDVFGQDQLYTVRFSGFLYTFVGWWGRKGTREVALMLRKHACTDHLEAGPLVHPMEHPPTILTLHASPTKPPGVHL